MFWIFRRTRLTSAVTLLNTLNNNGNGNRRPHKNYSKFPAEEINQQETLDNEHVCTKDEMLCTATEQQNGMDNDSAFTAYEDGNRQDFSDDSDYDEALTCNVCDRSFPCSKQLSSHKQKKRHFGCSACDSLFSSLMALEHHKEEFEHWSSGDEDSCTDSEDEDDDDTIVSEECERLL